MSQPLIIGSSNNVGVVGERRFFYYNSAERVSHLGGRSGVTNQEVPYIEKQPQEQKKQQRGGEIYSSEEQTTTKFKSFLTEDSSEILSFVLTGGPKWGFRIKQLQDKRVIISRVDKGPAEKCGLRVYDEILSVNNVHLVNSPCSLLLEEHYQRATVTETDRAPLLGAPYTPGPATVSKKQKEQQQQQQQQQQTTPMRVELSKLDFAYQLIKHSSGTNNKLMLTVRRFLSFSYARASALAASGSPWLPSPKDSRTEKRQRSYFDWSIGLGPLAQGNKENEFGSSGQPKELLPKGYENTGSSSGRNQAQSDTLSMRRPQTAGSVYKCCDCYCNQEGECPFFLQQNMNYL